MEGAVRMRRVLCCALLACVVALCALTRDSAPRGADLVAEDLKLKGGYAGQGLSSYDAALLKEGPDGIDASLTSAARSSRQNVDLSSWARPSAAPGQVQQLYQAPASEVQAFQPAQPGFTQPPQPASGYAYAQYQYGAYERPLQPQSQPQTYQARAYAQAPQQLAASKANPQGIPAPSSAQGQQRAQPSLLSSIGSYFKQAAGGSFQRGSAYAASGLPDAGVATHVMFSAQQQQQQMQRTTPQAVPQQMPPMPQVQAQLAPQQEQMPPQVRQGPSTLMAAAGYPLAPAQQPQPQPQPQVMTAQQQHATMMMQPLANAQGVLPGGAATPQKAQQLLQRARSLASSNGLAVTQAPPIAPGQVCVCVCARARSRDVRVCAWCVGVCGPGLRRGAQASLSHGMTRHARC